VNASAQVAGPSRGTRSAHPGPGQQPRRLARYHRRAARPGQRRHLIGQLGQRSFDALALQAGHIMIQLGRQRRQRPAAGPTEHDLLYQVTGQRLSQHAA
jgi:hypothetical protein